MGKGEYLLGELTEEPTENADLKIFVNRNGLGISSKAKTARATLLVTTVLALVALPILLLRMQVKHDLPMSVFFYADGLGTAAILAVAIMAMFVRVKRRL
jgi:hypothetical protein